METASACQRMSLVVSHSVWTLERWQSPGSWDFLQARASGWAGMKAYETVLRFLKLKTGVTIQSFNPTYKYIVEENYNLKRYIAPLVPKQRPMQTGKAWEQPKCLVK